MNSRWNDYKLFAQVGATYTSSSFTQTGNNPSLSVNGAVNTTLLRFVNPAYGLFDASVGIAKDAVERTSLRPESGGPECESVYLDRRSSPSPRRRIGPRVARRPIWLQVLSATPN